MVSQKVDYSDEFERHGAQPFKVIFAYMSSGCSLAINAQPLEKVKLAQSQTISWNCNPPLS